MFLFYGEYKRAAKLALAFGEKDYLHGSSAAVNDFLNRCMALYTAARQEKRHSKYSKLAKKIRKKIHQWATDGNPNVRHFASALEAEQAALDRYP